MAQAAGDAHRLAAAFNQLSIGVHFFATELPDVKRIYGSQPAPRGERA